MRAGPNTAVRVELMARQVPSCARNVTHDLLVTLLSHSHLINSHNPYGSLTYRGDVSEE